MKILVTGGAGFIGSNLVRKLLERSDISKVRVLDNYSTGFRSNLEPFYPNDKFELIVGDIRNLEDCLKACDGIDAISHQAALGSVPRSIEDPVGSHSVNVNGFLNVIEAARQSNIIRFVYASSSSVYGDLKNSPKQEEKIGKVLSPYAATKITNEFYAEAYARNYGMTCVGFRYFNVFGPYQDPNGPYAAVIPIFIKAALLGQSPVINGDGTITRDFTPVINVVNSNISALMNTLDPCRNYVFNVACGHTTSLNELWNLIRDITGAQIEASYGPNRAGDILFSLADISSLLEVLKPKLEDDLAQELTNTIGYYKSVIFGK